MPLPRIVLRRRSGSGCRRFADRYNCRFIKVQLAFDVTQGFIVDAPFIAETNGGPAFDTQRLKRKRNIPFVVRGFF